MQNVFHSVVYPSVFHILLYFVKYPFYIGDG